MGLAALAVACLWPARAAPADDRPADVVAALEEALVRVKETVAPAVVSISAIGGGREANANVYEDPFDLYRRRFFGEEAGPQQRQNVGSGVIIDPDGFVLTNHHVVAETRQVFVTLSDGRSFEGKVLGSDPAVDLAVIRIEAGGPLKALEWMPARDIRPGQLAIAFGNPWGLARDPQPTVTLGIVSAVNRSIGIGETGQRFEGLVQTDAAINPGNSGGPLVDVRGRIIGINTAIFSTTGGYQGIGFAVPCSDRVAQVVERLKKGQEVGHPWLGLTVSGIDAARAEALQYPRPKGLIVEQIEEGSPAARAELAVGDVIETIDGRPAARVEDLAEAMERAGVGGQLKLRVYRKGQPADRVVAVGARRGGPMAALSPRFWRGLSVRSLPPDAPEKGVLVDEVIPNSPAWKAGLRPGDVITKVNDLQVAAPSAFRDALKGAENQDVLLETSRGVRVVKRP